MKSLRLALLLAGAPLAGRAQEAVPDFSAGFVKLAALGMPELGAGARWAAVADEDEFDYQVQELMAGMRGNGWVEPNRCLAMGGLKTREPGNGKPPARDLDADVGKLIATLRKTAEKIDREDANSFRHEVRGFGRILVFAAQLHQAGRTDLANRLALALFAVYPSREAAVDGAVDFIASAFHQDVAAEFFAKGDWKSYHRELSSLTERFPRGWEAAGAVAMMLPQLGRQAAGGPPPVPSLPGVDIDPRALRIIGELERPVRWSEESEEEMRGYPPEVRAHMLMARANGGGEVEAMWLLATGGGEEDGEGPLQRLARLRMAALPALAAICGDSRFTMLPNPRASGWSYWSGGSEEERTLAIYQSLARPATRSEIASRMLAAALPDGNDDLDEADAETLGELALEFWKHHAEDSAEELAAVFLREGSGSQASHAAGILAASKDAAAHRMFEDHVLGSDPALSHLQAVQTYLRARRAAAKPFLDRYLKLIREQTPDEKDEQLDYQVRYLVQQAGGLDKIARQLEMLVEAQSPRSFAVQAAKGPPEDIDAALRTLQVMLKDASPKRSLYAYLEGASAAADAGVRGKFLSHTVGIEWPEQEAAREISASERRVWRKLMDDKRSFDTSQPGSETSSVPAAAASALEHSVAPAEYRMVYEMSAVIGREADKVLVERAAARLAGEPVPPLPDASKVSAERLAAIVAEAGARKPAEIHAYLSTLGQDERAAWAGWLDEPGELAMPASVKELAATVIRRDDGAMYGLDSTPGAGGIDVGFRVSRESFEAWLQSAAADGAKLSRTMLFLMPARFGPGLIVMSSVQPLPAAEDQNSRTRDMFWDPVSRLMETKDAETVIVAHAGLGETNASACWLARNGKPEPDDESSADVPAFLEMLDPGAAPTEFRMRIQILSRADAEKLSQNND